MQAALELTRLISRELSHRNPIVERLVSCALFGEDLQIDRITHDFVSGVGGVKMIAAVGCG